jgi:hypothetical protein
MSIKTWMAIMTIGTCIIFPPIAIIVVGLLFAAMVVGK